MMTHQLPTNLTQTKFSIYMYSISVSSSPSTYGKDTVVCQQKPEYLQVFVIYTARLRERTVSCLVPDHPTQRLGNLSVLDWDEVSSLVETLADERTQPVTRITNTEHSQLSTYSIMRKVRQLI